jgi:beta-N-acetylhexosaminidase
VGRREQALKYLTAAFALLRIVLVCSLLPLAVSYRTPLFASWRLPLLLLLVALPLAVIATDVWTLRRLRPFRASRWLSAASLALAVVALGITAAIELDFQHQRRAVLTADPAELEALGRHLLVGYRDGATLDALIAHRAIAGVYLSARNIEGKTIAEMRHEIDGWQATRRAQGLPPLWIATDQEGGAVSRLSPPLTRVPPLAEVVALHKDHAERLLAVRQYAARQGRELAALGVNLNFAPVVDLDHGVVNPDDHLSRISSRAISSDPAVVTEIATLYCETLKLTGVHCTLKHFPGLGRVFGDTHLVKAELDVPAQELEGSDWVPFRGVMTDGAAFTMLGHARLMQVDPNHPASFSQAVVHDLLRESWKYDGVLITDDFSMGAVTLTEEGATGGAVAALNAGVDLILVSYDPDQYYPIMQALLAAAREGHLTGKTLAKSDARLQRTASGADSAARHADRAVTETRHNP